MRLARLLARLAGEYDHGAASPAAAAAPALPFAAWEAHYLPHYFTLPPSAFHTWLQDVLDTFHVRRGQRQNVLAPRGAAKSTHCTQAYPLRAALEGHEPYTILAADTAPQADDYVAACRAELDGNEALRGAYWPLIRGMRARQGRIKLGNGCVIESASTGSKIRGRKNGPHRPSLIVIDDPQNLEHVISPTLRARSWQWLQSDVLNAGTPATNVLVLGTALHRECIVCQLQATPGWSSRLWRALATLPERLDLWAEWELLLHDHDDPRQEQTARAFYDRHRAEMDAGARALWPERESVYQLMSLRASIGPAAFESEKQSHPVNPEACEWPADYFTWPGLLFEHWPEELTQRVISLDPSKGRESRPGDYSAIVLAGLDPRGVVFYEADLKRRSTEAMLADLLGHVRRFGPDELVIETNQYQELLVAPLRALAADWKTELPPIHQVENTTNKHLRIRRLGPDFAQRRARFKGRSPGTALCLQQLQDFPHGAHDDGPDGVEMARRRLRHRGPGLDLR